MLSESLEGEKGNMHKRAMGYMLMAGAELTQPELGRMSPLGDKPRTSRLQPWRVSRESLDWL
jgi:hypothetical protein